MRRSFVAATKRSLFICWIGVFCFYSPLAPAQQGAVAAGAAQAASVPPSSVNRLITLDVVVSNESGQPVPGLQQQDFTLLDNNQPQKITSFMEASISTADPPAEVILVLDEVNTSYKYVAIARQAIEKFLNQNGAELPRLTSIIFFTDSGGSGTTPTRDSKALIEELRQRVHPLRNAKAAQGIYGAVERLNSSLRTLGQMVDYAAKRPGHKVVIWISPGWPQLASPRVDLTSKDQEGLFNNVIALSGSMRRARMTLYSVDPFGSGSVRKDYYKDFLKGVTAPRQVQMVNLSLQVLAYQSGGLVLNSSNDVAAEIATCAADASSFYVLSFEGAAAGDPNEYHTLQVKLDRPALKARTRTGYYAQPDQALP
jgi:VWFA-related protein